MVTGSRRSTDRNCCSTGFPATAWSHGAAGVVAHGQVILCRECRGVSSIGSRSNSMRDRSAIAPFAPQVLDASGTVLGRSCSNGMTGPRLPREGLRRSIDSTVNTEAEAGKIGLHSHVYWILGKAGCLADRAPD